MCGFISEAQELGLCLNSLLYDQCHVFISRHGPNKLVVENLLRVGRVTDSLRWTVTRQSSIACRTAGRKFQGASRPLPRLSAKVGVLEDRQLAEEKPDPGSITVKSFQERGNWTERFVTMTF